MASAQLKAAAEAAKKSLQAKVEALDAVGKDLANQRKQQETGEKKLKEEVRRSVSRRMNFLD